MVAMFVHIKGSSSQGCEIKGSSSQGGEINVSSFQGGEGTELNSAQGDVAQSAVGSVFSRASQWPPLSMRGSEDARGFKVAVSSWIPRRPRWGFPKIRGPLR